MLNFQKLYEEALKVSPKRNLTKYASCGGVGCALMTDKGSIYTGTSIECKASIGFCAENSAIAEMLKNGESEIKEIVSVSQGRDNEVITPCGKCREFMLQINPNNAKTLIGIGMNEGRELSELLPHSWMRF